MATVTCCIRGYCRVLNTVNRSYVTRNDIKGKKRPTGMCIKRGWVSQWMIPVWVYGSETISLFICVCQSHRFIFVLCRTHFHKSSLKQKVIKVPFPYTTQ